MFFLSDNDIVFKLAHCDLLGLLHQHLNVDQKEIWILSSCVYKLRSVLKANPTVLARVEAFCQAVSTINEAELDSNYLQTLQDTGIDAGEAILAAMACQTEDSYLITGDKRALIALNKLSDVALRSKLENRIYCFEALLLEMIKHYGFDTLRPHFMNGIASDKVLSMSFGDGRDESHAVECIGSYLNGIRESAGWLLVGQQHSETLQ